MLAGLVLIVVVLALAVPAGAQHTGECPVGDSDQVGIAPHDNCNDTTFHNDRQYSPGDTTQTINDINPIIQDQDFSQEDFSSGSVDSQSDIANQGDNNILCPTVQQSGSTDIVANQQGLEPFNTNFEDADLTGNATETSPTQGAECAPTLGQEAVAQESPGL
jgi:hypothetical protein